MTEHRITRDGITLHARVDGPADRATPTVVFANSLGTTLHLWDPVMDLLPAGIRYVRWDTRGHGQSDAPIGPYSMGQLIADAEAVCDQLAVRNAVYVGLSVGGMIAQGLAVKRMDIVRALVLSNTAARIGNPTLWADRIAAIEAHGIASLSDTVMQRWFGRDFYGTPAMNHWQRMLEDTPRQGYTGVCAAIAGTDFMTPTSGLRLPTLGIAGSEDGSTPPDLVRETLYLIPGASFHIIRRAGHLPCVEQPDAYARILTDFLIRTGTVADATAAD
ncbi:3-oxoadipate enol-lactonase [Loktanella fryxellensis]|uniref:3-oxoadipate enol-lactonase n=1 Tax=Loktanella fryxellensis TaxID=245187 RepID=A0A1H8A8J9_9RHOB|nr:3-oxoadipate enol-lactonase [Loktanella fryxellensis]SEM66796.1 3-oxoadipate enol-lactonase [Loktanella fryxellensis]